MRTNDSIKTSLPGTALENERIQSRLTRFIRLAANDSGTRLRRLDQVVADASAQGVGLSVRDQLQALRTGGTNGQMSRTTRLLHTTLLSEAPSTRLDDSDQKGMKQYIILEEFPVFVNLM